MLSVNLDGTVTGVRCFAELCIAQGRKGGSVVVVSFIAALVGLPSVSSNDASSKAALLGFVGTAMHDLGAHDLRQKVVAPDRLDIEMVRESGDGIIATIAAQTELRRFGAPDELGEAVEFLLAPRTLFITGTCLNVTSGWSEA